MDTTVNNTDIDGNGVKRMEDLMPKEIVLPPFADDRNRKLAKEIAIKRAEYARLLALTNEQEERKKAMEEHTENLKVELLQAQSIFEAKKRQLDSEKNLLQLSQLEIRQLHQNMATIKKELADITKQISELEENSVKGQKKIDDLKEELNITKAEWQDWLKTHADKEEDHLALERYTKEDARRITELTIKVKRLTYDITKRKQLLSQQMAFAQLNRTEVARTTDHYKALNRERQELLGKWESTVQMVAKRDADVENANERQIQMEMEITEKRADIRQKSDEQAAIQSEINDCEKRIYNLEKQLAANIRAFNDKSAEYNELKLEVAAMRSSLTKLEHNIKNQKSTNGELDEDLTDKLNTIEKQKARKIAAEKRLAETKSESLTIQEKNQQLEEMLIAEETRKKRLEKEFKELSDSRHKDIKRLQDLRADERRLNFSVKSAEASLKSIRSSILKLEEQMIIEEIHLYNHSFEVQQMERKLRRVQGERTKEETVELKAKIAKLEKELDEWTRKVNLLSAENRQTNQELSKSKKALERLLNEKDKLEGELSELTMQVETATNQLNNKITEKDDFIVDESLLKLDLKKLRAAFEDKSDKLLTAEARQEQLQLFIEERIKEIDAHKDILRMAAKLAEEERFDSALKFREAVTKVEKIKSKYEVIMMNLQCPEEEAGETTQVFFIMKNAKKKEELRRERHDVGETLAVIEQEVMALEGTLEAMLEQNNALRQLLKRQNSNVQDMEQKKILEERVKTLMDEYRAKRKVLMAVEEEIHQLEEKIEEEEAKNAKQNESLGVIENDLKKIELELNAQVEKKDRAEKLCSKLQKDWRVQSKSNERTEEELDIELKEIKEENRQMYNMLKAAAENNTESTVVFETYCEQNGITPPSRAPSTIGSAANSRSQSRSQSRLSISRAATRTPAKMAKPVITGSTLDEALKMATRPKTKQNSWSSKKPLQMHPAPVKKSIFPRAKRDI